MLTKTAKGFKKVKVRVEAATNPGETVVVCGSTPELGEWDVAKSIILTLEDNSSEIWSGNIEVPCDGSAEFRYLIAIIVENMVLNGANGNGSILDYDEDGSASMLPGKSCITTTKDVIVRRWETNIKPRLLRASDIQANDDPTIDTFGTYNGKTCIEAGWITKETIVQFKLSNNPITIWKNRYKNRPFSFRVSPIDLKRKDSEAPKDHSMMHEVDNESTNPADIVPKWPVIEISVMNDEEWGFQQQEQLGRIYNSSEYVIFRAQMTDPDKTAYMVDLYLQDNHNPGEHLGFCYILPSNLRDTSGTCTMPIAGNKHQPIGQLTLDYLVIKPPKGFESDANLSYAKHWKPVKKLDVGHRGAGNARRTDKVENVLENTVASFNFAARHGADMVELDVHLSKDKVPIIYHDYNINISMKKKKNPTEHEFFQVAVKDLTISQLQMLKLSPILKPNKSKYDFHDDDSEDNQPFPTLQHILEAVDSKCGFNIEIKYPQQRSDGSWEAEKGFDYNEYVDIILKTIMQYAGDRYIILSCFHPDICTMIRLKQNTYPLLFLTNGQTEKYVPFSDYRTSSVQMATYFALAMGFLGIDVHAEDLLRDRSLVNFVKSRKLVLFCWGEDLKSTVIIEDMKKDGVDGVIYDKIDLLNTNLGNLYVADAKDARMALLEVVSGQAHEVSPYSSGGSSASP